MHESRLQAVVRCRHCRVAYLVVIQMIILCKSYTLIAVILPAAHHAHKPCTSHSSSTVHDTELNVLQCKATFINSASLPCRSLIPTANTFYNNCCYYYLLQLQGQAVVRGWFKRRVAAKERAKRLLSLRGHLFELWKRAHSPLLHRSKFWTLFQGGGLLDLAVHEVHTNIVLAHYSSIQYLMLCKQETS
jgi:hypothetical protein